MTSLHWLALGIGLCAVGLILLGFVVAYAASGGRVLLHDEEMDR